MTVLGDLLRDTKEEHGASLQSLTVLAVRNDPYRLDTEANHRNGQWLHDQMEACGLLDRGHPIHLRGIHYAIVARGDAIMPSGLPYINDAACWAYAVASIHSM
jgi:hypothetical protein